MAAHDVLDAMNDPSEDLTRVEKSYSRCLPKQRVRIDEPGVPEICAFQSLRDSILA